MIGGFPCNSETRPIDLGGGRGISLQIGVTATREKTSFQFLLLQIPA